MRKIILLSVISIISFSVFGQDQTNKGKEFWLVFPAHVASSAQAQMGLFITSDKNSSGTISVNGFNTTFTVSANLVTGPILIPYANANVGTSNIVLNRGIHVVVNPGQPPVVLYAHIFAGFRSEASLILPVSTLGKKYYSSNFWQASTGGSQSQFNIVATEPNTVVQYQKRVNGVLSGVTTTVNLPNPGDQIQVQDGNDLSGSIIESIASGTGGCNRIAVFSGSSALSISRLFCNGNSFDPLYQQCYPVSTWGKEFGVAPLSNNPNGFHARVMASEDNTSVNFNGTTIILNQGEYYPATGPNLTTFTTPMIIAADKPISVSQYMLSGNCSGSTNFPGQSNPQGDPDMVILNPVEQSISDINLFSSNLQNIRTKYLNVYMKTVGASTFRINGNAPIAPFLPMPQNNGYSYLQEDLTGYVSTSFRLVADSGFNAITYGMGDAESYAYSAGTNVRDLNQQLEVNSPNGIETAPNICTGSPFGFKVYFPDKTVGATPTLIRYDSMRWDCSNTTVMTPNNFPVVVYGTPTVNPDSINVRNGKDVAWYSIPGQYSFSTPGVYDITVTVYRTSTEGCGNEQEYTFQLTVTDPPGGSFTNSSPGCYLEPVQFTETTPQTPKETYKWFWDFGDGSPYSFLLRNPLHTYAAAGTYTVRYAGVTTPGCVTDTISMQVVVPDVPSATITGDAAVCINDPAPLFITFTATGGRSPYEFTYSINNAPDVTITTAIGVSTITIPVPTNVAGAFNYYLRSVKNLGSTLCTQLQPDTVLVTVLPDATIALSSAPGTDNQTICINSAIGNITYAIGGSGTGGNVTGLPAGVTGTYAGGIITITGTPTVSGTFNYIVSTTGPCVKPTIAGTLTVTADGTLALSSAPATDNQTICINTPLVQVTYSTGGSVAGGIVTGLPAGVVFTVTSNTIFLSGTPSVAGTFNYTVSTIGPCVKPTATGTIVVTADATLNLSSPGGTDNQTVCVNNPVTTIIYAVGGTGTGGAVTGLPAGVAGIYAGGVITITGTPTVSGTFIYSVTTTGPCAKPATTGILNVTADGILTLSSGAGSDNQTVCINTPFSTILYTAGGSLTGGTVTGLPAGVTGTYAGGVITILGSPTVAGTFNYTVNTAGPCIKPTATGTLVVNADATLNLTSAAGTNNQTTCVNTAITNVTYAVGGTGTGGGVVGLPAGVTGTYAAGVIIITGTPTVSGTFNYTVNTTGPCFKPAATGTITVSADATLALTSPAGTDNQAVCINTAITNIIYAVGGGGTGATITGLPAGVTGTYVSGVFTIQGTPTATGTFNYTVNTTGPCIKPIATGTIVITGDATLNLTSAAGTNNQTVCINTPIVTVTYAVAGTGTGGNVTGLPAGLTGTYAAGVITIIGTPTVSGIFNYTVNTTGPCFKPALTGTITVSADATLALSSAAGTNNQVVCVNNTITSITYAVGGGGTGGNVTGLPAGITGVYTSGVITISGTPTASGTFTYTVNTTGPCVKPTATGTITINPLPTALVSGNIEVCQNAPSPAITFTGAGGTAPYTFTYSINGAPDVTVTTTVGNSATVLQPTTTVNTFTYVLKRVQDATVSLCNQVQSGTVTVKVNPLPTAAISGARLICINSASPDITFTGANGTTPYTFRYRINGGPLLTVTTTGTNNVVAVPVATNVAGTFTYALEDVRDGSATACLQLQTGNAVIDISNVFPNPLFAFSDTVCLPNALVQFQNQSTIANGAPNTMTYLWNFGDGSPTSNSFQPSHRYNAVGPFTVTLQATSNAGCVTITPIAVNSIHAQPKAAFSIDKPAGVCIGDFVLLNDLSDPKDGTTDKWNWDLGDGTRLTSNPVSYRYTAATTYTIQLYSINSFGCNSDTVSQPFTVHPYPVVNAGPDGIVLEGGSYTMQPTVTGNDLQYLWSPANFLNSATIAAPTATGMMDDITYKLVVTGRGGCEAAPDFVFIKVLKAPKVPNTFTPNGDGINELWLIDYLDTYPNCKVQVFTRTGQLVFESKGYKTPWNGKLNGKPLPFDTYYYIIEPGNNRAPITGYVTIVK